MEREDQTEDDNSEEKKFEQLYPTKMERMPGKTGVVKHFSKSMEDGSIECILTKFV